MPRPDPTADAQADDQPVYALRGAEQAASQLNNDPAVQPVQACPSGRRHALEVWIGGEDGAPLPGIVVELSRGAGDVLCDQSGVAGTVRFEQLPAGGYHLSLRELDRDAWELIDSVALEGGDDGGPGDAPWSPPPPMPPAPPPHTVRAGECIASLAGQYGFFPRTIWDFSANSGLRARRASPYVLYAGDATSEADVVHIPARRINKISVSSGARYRLRRLGVPEMLRLRFMVNDQPRGKLPYLLALSTADQAAVPDQQGTLDDDGYLACAVPPGAEHAVITLIDNGEEQVCHVDIGYLDPLSTWSGARAVLHNLGYDCGGEEDEASAPAVRAIRRFQEAYGLALTGKLDQAARDQLKLLHPAG